MLFLSAQGCKFDTYFNKSYIFILLFMWAGEAGTRREGSPARGTDSALARGVCFLSLNLWVSTSEFGSLDKERRCYGMGKKCQFNFLSINTKAQHQVRNILTKFSKNSRGLQWAIAGDKINGKSPLGMVNGRISLLQLCPVGWNFHFHCILLPASSDPAGRRGQRARGLVLPSQRPTENNSPAPARSALPSKGALLPAAGLANSSLPCSLLLGALCAMRRQYDHTHLPSPSSLFLFFFWKMTMNAHEASITKDYGLQFSVCRKVVLNDQMLMRREALLEK